MKSSKVFLLVTLATFLFACAKTGESTISSSSSESISESSSSSPSSSSNEEDIPSDPDIDGLGEVIKGAFGYENESIYSKRDSSIMELNQRFDYGTLIFQFKTFSTFSDNGILLHVDDSNNPQNYYFVGFDILGRLSLVKYENNIPTPLYQERVGDTYNKRFVTIGVSFVQDTKSINLYYSNVEIASCYEENFINGNKIYDLR